MIDMEHVVFITCHGDGLHPPISCGSLGEIKGHIVGARGQYARCQGASQRLAQLTAGLGKVALLNEWTPNGKVGVTCRLAARQIDTESEIPLKKHWQNEPEPGMFIERPAGYEELVQRDKVSLDLIWLRDESLEDSENLPPPEVIAQEIVEDLEAALAEFAAIAESLRPQD